MRQPSQKGNINRYAPRVIRWSSACLRWIWTRRYRQNNLRLHLLIYLIRILCLRNNKKEFVLRWVCLNSWKMFACFILKWFAEKHTLCLLMTGMSSLWAEPSIFCMTPCWNWRKMVGRYWMNNSCSIFSGRSNSNHLTSISSTSLIPKKIQLLVTRAGKILERKSKRNCSTQSTKRIKQRRRLWSS